MNLPSAINSCGLNVRVGGTYELVRARTASLPFCASNDVVPDAKPKVVELEHSPDGTIMARVAYKPGKSSSTWVNIELLKGEAPVVSGVLKDKSSYTSKLKKA